MLKKVLIANRGEIAVRIIRTARRMGIATVAVCSEADAEALHVRLADAAVAIGPAPAAQSYLDPERLIAAASASGCDCVHPGYGFLAESAAFADACRAAGLVFIGPSGEAMRRLGDKQAAKALARTLGIPVVPGYEGALQDAATLSAEAARIGYPVMIKAAAGGGGRGMRLVASPEDFASALESAGREAMAAFNDGRVLIERAIDRPRHIEVQVFADRHGNVVHLFERDCSLQRRHQKIIEEAPAPGMTVGLRAALTGAAVRLAREVGYEGAGTVEFLVEQADLHSPRHYFIEANTRLQVEHPVSEAITSLDLVEWQFHIAAGEPLPLSQEAIRITGHAVEARICAEDPARAFLPSSGAILSLALPRASPVRLESGVEQGDTISTHYDSLILKAIAHGPDRATALWQLASWLEDSVLLGVATNMGLLYDLLTSADVRAGALDTGLIARRLGGSTRTPSASGGIIARGVGLLLDEERRRAQRARRSRHNDPPSPWDTADAFQLGAGREIVRSVLVDGHREPVKILWREGRLHVTAAGGTHEVGPRASATASVYDRAAARALLLERWQQHEVAWADGAAGEIIRDQGGEGIIRAPINGRIAQIFVVAGQPVSKGDRLAIVEAMKMEHVLHAGADGVIERVVAKAGDTVALGAVIAEIGPAGRMP